MCDRQNTCKYARADNGHAKAALALLNGGAGLEVTETDGTTALMTAAVTGNAAVLNILIDAGIDQIAF
jgi:ankyrin repeat protein